MYRIRESGHHRAVILAVSVNNADPGIAFGDILAHTTSLFVSATFHVIPVFGHCSRLGSHRAVYKVSQRLKHLGMSNDAEYGKRNHINTEIAYSREIFRKHPNWPVIDVTNRAIEETAADILRIYQERMSGERAAG